MHLDEDENMTLFVEVSMSWAIFICFVPCFCSFSDSNVLRASLRCIGLHLLWDILGISRWVMPDDGSQWYLCLGVGPLVGHVLSSSAECPLEWLHSRGNHVSGGICDLPCLSPDTSFDHQPNSGPASAAAAGCQNCDGKNHEDGH